MYGVVGDFWGEGISDKTFQKELKALGDVKKLTIRLNSPGGDVFQGWTIYNLLKQHKAEITVFVDGMAASIASIIALAGDKIIMGDGAQIMIHRAWTGAYGNAGDFEKIVDRLDSIDAQLVKTYAAKTGKSQDEIKAMVDAETWFDADQAIEIGLADEKSEDTYAIAASILDKATWVRKFPKNLVTEQEAAKEKAANLKNKIEEFLARK